MSALKGSGSHRIGELAAASGLTPDTLRYYERLELLPPPPRTSGRFRMYPPGTLQRLRFIRQAQTLGLTLHEIQDLVSCQDQRGLRQCRRVRDLLRTKLAQLQAKLSELEEFRSTLAGCLQECERTLAGQRGQEQRAEPECPVMETLGTRTVVKREFANETPD